MENEKDRGEVVLYQPNDTIRLEVKLDQETVWLTQQQIAMLMGTNVPAISKHIANIYDSQELDKTSTVSKMEIVRMEGNRLVKRTVDHYNLDMIISVGYRVNSINATAFRRWATTVLKQYLLRGYSINQQLMQIEDRIDRRGFMLRLSDYESVLLPNRNKHIQDFGNIALYPDSKGAHKFWMCTRHLQPQAVKDLSGPSESE